MLPGVAVGVGEIKLVLIPKVLAGKAVEESSLDGDAELEELIGPKMPDNGTTNQRRIAKESQQRKGSKGELARIWEIPDEHVCAAGLNGQNEKHRTRT